MSKFLTPTVHVWQVSWKSWNTLIHYEHTLETQMRDQNKGPHGTFHYPRTEHPVLWLFIYSPHSYYTFWMMTVGMCSLHNAFWNRSFFELWKQNCLLFPCMLNHFTPYHSNFTSENDLGGKIKRWGGKVLQNAVLVGKHVYHCYDK